MQFSTTHSLSTLNNASKDKWVFALLLFLIFWMPVPLGSNRPWAWGMLEIMAFITIAGSVFYNPSVLVINIKKYPAAFASFLAFTLWVFLQQVPLPADWLHAISPNSFKLFALTNSDNAYNSISVDPAQTTIAVYKTLAYFSLFTATLILCRSEKRIKAIMLTIIFTGLFQALYGSLEVLLGMQNSLVFQLPVKGIATGTFVYKNHYANFLMLCLSIGVGYLVSTLLTHNVKARKAKLRHFLNTLLNGKAVVRIALAIMVIALVMSRSRMGNTAFFAAMTAIGLLALILVKKRSKGLTLLIVSMFIIDMFIVSAWFGLDKVKERLENTALVEETRDEVVRDSIPLLKDYIYTGSGLGSFYSIYPKYQSEEVKGFYDHAHNDYLQFAVEAGIIASALLLILPAYCLITALQAMRTRRNNLMQGLSFGCLMAIVGMFIHISVDFPLQAPANTGLFVIILALALITQKKSKRGLFE